MQEDSKSISALTGRHETKQEKCKIPKKGNMEEKPSAVCGSPLEEVTSTSAKARIFIRCPQPPPKSEEMSLHDINGLPYTALLVAVDIMNLRGGRPMAWWVARSAQADFALLGQLVWAGVGSIPPVQLLVKAKDPMPFFEKSRG